MNADATRMPRLPIIPATAHLSDSDKGMGRDLIAISASRLTRFSRGPK